MYERILTNPPLGWQSTILGACCSQIQVGVRMTKGEPTGVPVVMPENISENRVDTSNMSRMPLSQATLHRQSRLKYGDIVCSRLGNLGRRALVTEKEENWLCGTGCLHLQVSPSTDPRFLFYYLGYPLAQSWISRHADGTTMPHIRKCVFSNLPVVLPPLSLQIEMAGILGAFDQKIALNRRMNESLENIAQRLLQDAIESKPVFSAEASHTTIGSVCSRVENGRTPDRNNADYWNPATIPWMNSKEIFDPAITGTEQKISRDGLENSRMKIWPKGTVVVALCGEIAGQVSILALDACANQACCGLGVPKEMQACLYFYLRSCSRLLRQLTRGKAQQNLNQQILTQFPFPVLEPGILQSLNDKLRPLLDRIILNVGENAKLVRLRDALLPKLISNEFSTVNSHFLNIAN